MLKKSMLFPAISMAIVLIILSCGPTIFLDPNFEEYRPNHKIIAIMPFEVIIDPNKLPKEYTLEMKQDAENAEAYNFQNELYTQFLKRQEKGEYTIDFQDVHKTNALLSKEGIDNRSMDNYTKEELYDILKADAIISGTIHRSRPMSSGGAVALGILTGFWGRTNEVNINMNIHDSKSGQLLWTYDHKASGTVGSSSEKLAESLMKNVSKKFPYKKPKS